MKTLSNLKEKISFGVDAKILQYEENAKIICGTQIDLKNIIETYLFKKSISQNCIMINIEKDHKRYLSTVEELKKISISNFIHLKATYWKEKENLEKDLSFILKFLKQFNSKIKVRKIKIDEFSEINDENIYIQDGPLACYCSHLRALIYGYLNFKDYTIVIEDDIVITNTEYIETYLKCIPDDWDIVCLNSAPKNKTYDAPFYKFTDEFHSGHFYIVNHKCMPILFKHMYPITDQVDVLTSNLFPQLNIYNIPDTVYQKNISTNTQNNLHVIFNSPHYYVVRTAIDKIKQLCMFFANRILPDNEERNGIIVDNLMYDVLYEFIIDDSGYKTDKDVETYHFDDSEHIKLDEYNELLYYVDFFLRCSKKGIKTKEVATSLLNAILFTLQNFKLHNKSITHMGNIKAYGFGSTANVYILGEQPNNKLIIKNYNDKLRWITDGHDNSFEIFKREFNILQKLQHLDCVPKLLAYNYCDKSLGLTYAGESLYNDFRLPEDWKEQIKEIFNSLTDSNICYPEFRLQNILVLDDKISFVDFGLAYFETLSFIDNPLYCERFIKLLGLMKDRFANVKDRNIVHYLSNTLLNNEKNKL